MAGQAYISYKQIHESQKQACVCVVRGKQKQKYKYKAFFFIVKTGVENFTACFRRFYIFAAEALGKSLKVDAFRRGALMLLTLKTLLRAVLKAVLMVGWLTGKTAAVPGIGSFLAAVVTAALRGKTSSSIVSVLTF